MPPDHEVGPDFVELSAGLSAALSHRHQRELLEAATRIRRVLSGLEPPIAAALEGGVLEPLLALLRGGFEGCSAEAQLEAAWAVTNLLSGSPEQTARVLAAGATQQLLGILSSPAAQERPELCDQVLWALGNAAGDGAGPRDALLHAGIMTSLGQMYAAMPGFTWGVVERSSILRTLTWLMSNLCAGSPPPPLTDIDCLFDFFVEVVMSTDDARMLAESLWGLSHLIEGACESEGDARVARMLTVGFSPGEVPRAPDAHPLLVRVVAGTRPLPSRAAAATLAAPVARHSTREPAMKLLATLVSTLSSDVTDVVLAAGGVEAFKECLGDRAAGIRVRKEAAWALSNVAAGTASQALLVAADPGVWEAVRSTLEGDADPEVQRQSAWTVANLVKRREALQNLDCMDALRLVTLGLRQQATDGDLQRHLLDAAEALLCHWQALGSEGGKNLFVCPQAESSFWQVLQELQNTAPEAVRRKALHVATAWSDAGQKCGRKGMTLEPCPGPCAVGPGFSQRAAYKFGA